MTGQTRDPQAQLEVESGMPMNSAVKADGTDVCPDRNGLASLSSWRRESAKRNRDHDCSATVKTGRRDRPTVEEIA
jgi:hypothetical protein